MEKRLPIQSVSISAWAEQNFLFGIVKNEDTGRDWIMNNFIQLRGAHYVSYLYDAVDSSITFYPYAIHQLTPNMFDFCPYIDKYSLPKKYVKSNYSCFFDFVKKAVDDDFYISTFLNQSFRKDKKLGKTFNHPNYIYGYDDCRGDVYMIDNFENGKYVKKTISGEELNYAFEKVTGDLWEVSVFLYKLKKHSHNFSILYLKEQIEDYLHPNRGLCYLNRMVCMESYQKNQDTLNEVFFGVDCYLLLLNYITALIENDSNYLPNDWRSFSMLIDHKQLMLERYLYLIEHNYIRPNNTLEKKLRALKNKCIILRNIFLKYILQNNTILLFQIAEYISELQHEDCDCMELFIKQIEEGGC